MRHECMMHGHLSCSVGTLVSIKSCWYQDQAVKSHANDTDDQWRSHYLPAFAAWLISGWNLIDPIAPPHLGHSEMACKDKGTLSKS